MWYNTTKKNDADFSITGSMGFYMVAALTDEARFWVADNVVLGDYQDGYNFACEGRYVQDLTEGMLANGFTVLVNGQEAYLKNGDILLKVPTALDLT